MSQQTTRYFFICSLTFSKDFTHGHVDKVALSLDSHQSSQVKHMDKPLQKHNMKRQWTSGSVTLAEGPQSCEFNSLTFTAYV